MNVNQAIENFCAPLLKYPSGKLTAQEMSAIDRIDTDGSPRGLLVATFWKIILQCTDLFYPDYLLFLEVIDGGCFHL